MEQHFVEEPCQEGWHRPVLSLFAKIFTVFSCKLPKVACFQKRACRMAGRTGSHLQQRKTGSSRWGTPCQPYRVWIFAACVLRGAPCFCFIRICLRTILLANHPLQHAASGSRPPHGSEPDAENVHLIPAFCAKMPCRHAGMQCRFLASFPRLFA